MRPMGSAAERAPRYRSSPPRRMSLVLAAARRVAGAGHGGATERSTGRRAVFTESTTEKWPRFTSRLRFLARAGSRGIASGPAWWRAEQTHFFFGYSPPA